MSLTLSDGSQRASRVRILRLRGCFGKPSSSPAQDGNDVRASLLKKAAPFLGPLLKRQSGGLIQEWRCGEPVRQPERQQERCREQQVKVIRLSAASFVGLHNAFARPKNHHRMSQPFPGYNSMQYKHLRLGRCEDAGKSQGAAMPVGMQNPAHSLHCSGRREWKSDRAPGACRRSASNKTDPRQLSRGSEV